MSYKTKKNWGKFCFAISSGAVTVTCHPRLYGVSCLYGGQKEGPHYGQGKNWAPTSVRMAFI